MSEKTILRLHANGDFETIDTPLIEGEEYSFSADYIKVPMIVTLREEVNLFKPEESVPGYINENNGQIYTGYEYDRASGFIPVKKGQTIKVESSYKDIRNDRPWVCLCFYDTNKSYVSTLFARHGLYSGASEGTYSNIFNIPEGVHYIRFSTNLYTHPTTQVTIIIKENSGIPLPYWVKDTGNPVSFFPEGVVIKGEILGSKKQETIIFIDNFNRVSLNDLGSGWVSARGTWTIENNKAKSVASSSIALCTTPHGDNVSISAEVTRYLSESIVFRAKDENNHLYAQFDGEKLKLKNLVNGSSTTLKTYEMDSQINRTYKLRVELRGTEIKLFVDDVLRMTHETDFYLSEQLCGLQSWTGDSVKGRFDNFEVKTLSNKPEHPVYPTELLFYDNFNRDNSSSLGGDWKVINGRYNVETGLAKPKATWSETNTVIVDVGESNNLRVSSMITPFKEEALLIRYLDANNYIRVVNGSGRVDVTCKINGTEKRYGSINTAVAGPRKITTELIGNSIKIFVNDVFWYTVYNDDFLINSNKFGLYAWSDSGILETIGSFDDFVVEKIIL